MPGRPRETNGGNGTIHFSSCSQAFPVCYRVGDWASSFSFLVTPLGHGLEDWPWPCCGQRGVEQSETMGFHGKNPQLSAPLVHISQTFLNPPFKIKTWQRMPPERADRAFCQSRMETKETEVNDLEEMCENSFYTKG